MKKLKMILCISLWSCIIFTGIKMLSQGIHDENVVAQMSQSTYDEIVDTLTLRNNGSKPNEHQIVTYYYERFKK